MTRALHILFSACALCLSAHAAKQPNFVIFMADDLGYGDVGYQGGDVPTPNIDSLASSGIQFTDGYVTCPVCAPSRAGMLTGRNQQTFGFWDNIGPYRVDAQTEPGIPVTLPILSERLQALGYVTGLFGKTHDGDAEAMMAFNRWDEFFGFNNGASNFLGDLNHSHNPIFHNKQIVSQFYADRGIHPKTINQNGVLIKDSENYLTDQLADYAIRFIEANRERPFLCYIPFNAIHGPFQAPKELVDQYADEPDRERRIVKAMLDSMDTNIGRVLESLRTNDLMEDTLIIFLSDNGGHEASPSLPLRGKKATYWEGGLRVPFCISWQGKLPGGGRYRQPVSSLDIMPTLITAAGGRVEADWQLDGVNLLPYLSGKVSEAPHESLYWVWGPRKAIRSGNFKAVSHNHGKTFELYDLSKDISEQNNLARQNPELLQHLIQKHSQWEAQLPPQGWGWNSKLGYKDPTFGKPKPYHDPNYIIK
jgi:arylsulfatase A-like enzyme